MATLDRYLEALRTPGAQAMTFRSGAPVEVLVNGASRAVSKGIKTVEQLRAILTEVLPPDFRFEPDGVARDFPYEARIGRVRLTVKVVDAGIVVRTTPWGAASAPAQAEKMVIDPTRHSPIPPPPQPRASTKAQVPLFAGIARREIQSVLDACVMHTFLAGDEIFAEGDPGGSLWIIEAGTVEIFKTIRGNVDRLIATFEAGAVFGEMSFLDGNKRSASARPTEPTNVLMLERAKFDRVAEEHPRVAATFFAGLATVIAERLRLTNEVYGQSVASHPEVTGALTLQRLVEEQRVVTVHLIAGGSMKGTLVELQQQQHGWTLVLKDREGGMSLVPYQAVVRIEVA